MRDEKIEIIRKCLETTYNNVTFVKSTDLENVWGNTVSTTTYWKVGMFETALSVTFDDNGMVYATSQNCAVTDNGLGMNEFIKEKLFENKQNEKVENTMENTKKIAGIELNVLRNGVRVLENGIENDFSEAQRILNVNRFARDVDAECAYNPRDYSQFENTYEVKVERNGDYDAFIRMMNYAKCLHAKYDELYARYFRDEITSLEYREIREEHQNCECSVCKAVQPTFEQWKNNSIEFTEWNEFTESERTKQMKLGKYLGKQKFSSEIIDFYSAQIKDEKTVYLTITSAPQFIAGMSYYAKSGSWDGYEGTSCMDTRHGGTYSKKLGGALADNMLHIAMLHESMDDLQSMDNKLLARVLMRPVEVEDEIVLIPTKYYGNNATKDMLHYSLKQLEELLVYSTDVAKRSKAENNDSFETLEMSIDGGYEMESSTEVNVYDTVSVSVSCECPACDGYGEMTREIEVNGVDRDVTFTCPVCDGDGQYETEVDVEYDEYVNVEHEETVYAYAENEGDHYQLNEEYDEYEMTVNVSMIERAIEKYINGVDEVIEVDEELKEVEA